MITVSDVLDFLEGFAPPELAESWDNVGLLVGDKEKEVHKIFLALDVLPLALSLLIRSASNLILTYKKSK